MWYKAINCARMACASTDIKIAEWFFNTDFSVSSDPAAEPQPAPFVLNDYKFTEHTRRGLELILQSDYASVSQSLASWNCAVADLLDKSVR